jgi:hypothetical protein
MGCRTKLSNLGARLTALEAQGANTTRTLLNHIIQEVVTTREVLIERISGVEKMLSDRLDRVEKQLKVLTLDVMQVRTDQPRLEDRMDAMERRPN